MTSINDLLCCGVARCLHSNAGGIFQNFNHCIVWRSWLNDNVIPCIEYRFTTVYETPRFSLKQKGTLYNGRDFRGMLRFLFRFKFPVPDLYLVVLTRCILHKCPHNPAPIWTIKSIVAIRTNVIRITHSLIVANKYRGV